MALFRRQIQFIDGIPTILNSTLRKSLEGNGDVLEKNITEDQLFTRGIDGNEKKLAGYARTTIKTKIRKGQPFDRTTLRDTEEFHRTLDIMPREDEVEIGSEVPYQKFLVKRYGSAILRPTLQNWTAWFTKFFIPNLKREVNGQLAR